MRISPRATARANEGVGGAEWFDRATAIFRPSSSGVVNVSHTKVFRSQALNSPSAETPATTSATRDGSASTVGSVRRSCSLLPRPRILVRDDPDEHILAGLHRRLHLAASDAATAFLRLEPVAMRDDADGDVARARQALALLDRCARQRAEAFHRHRLL